NELWELFQQLRLNLDKSYYEILDEAYDKLCYYLSHQTRKTYLNSQFSVSLREIDEDGALIVIAYAIRHFVQLENDLTSGEKIETAITHIRGTLVAQLEPNRNTETKVKTLAGISEWYYWQWPCEGIYDGYIQARELPNVGKWTNFSPSQIN
ncbi:3045_t:CDS:2, partial [Ambispora leptoticha]